MLNVQSLFGKETGIRIRGEIVSIEKNELGINMELQQVQQIALGFGKYLFFKGFQVAYGIFDHVGSFDIIYAINSVSYGDGSKYKHNNADVKDEQINCLKSIIDAVTGKNVYSNFDFRMLEYY